MAVRNEQREVRSRSSVAQRKRRGESTPLLSGQNATEVNVAASRGPGDATSAIRMWGYETTCTATLLALPLHTHKNLSFAQATRPPNSTWSEPTSSRVEPTPDDEPRRRRSERIGDSENGLLRKLGACGEVPAK